MVDTVWTTDYIDYPDQAGVDGYYASEQAAVDSLKARYAAPYIVEWQEYRERAALMVEGTFAQVPGYSTAHVGLWEIEEHEVVDAKMGGSRDNPEQKA